MIACALAVTGCATLLNKAIDKTGEVAGRKIGTEIARRQAPPKAAVKIQQPGGSFCGVMRAYRFPEVVPLLSDPAIDALGDRASGILDDVDGHGEKNCPGWR